MKQKKLTLMNTARYMWKELILKKETENREPGIKNLEQVP